MDFNTLNTKDPAEAGAFLHLRNPFNGDLLWEVKKGKDGEEEKREAVGVFLRGTESHTVTELVKKQEKKALMEASTTGRRGRKSRPQDDGNGIEFAMALVISFQNVQRGKEPLDPKNSADVEWFFEQSPDFVQQVISFSSERDNFLPENWKS